MTMGRKFVLLGRTTRRTSVISQMFSTATSFKPPVEYFKSATRRNDYLATSHSPDESDLAELVSALAECRVHELPGDTGVTAISVNCYLGFEGFADNIIYARRFYPDLLAAVRSNKRCIFTSNPGVSKSVFLYYYLARLLNSSAFDPLPPDCFGSLVIPSVAIIQTGSDSMEVIFIKERIVHRFEQISSKILRYFHPRTSLYFFEPDNTRNVCPFFGRLELPILATVSPLKARIHEFFKNGGVKVYMPSYEEEELVCIAEHMRSVDATCSITEEQVKERYNQFGGVIRHVLGTQVSVDDFVTARKNAVRTIDIAALIAEDVLENNLASHLVVKYIIPSTGQYAFTCQGVDFVTMCVYEMVKMKLSKLSIENRVYLLLRNDETGSMGKCAPKVFEELIVLLLAKRETKPWRVRRQSDGHIMPMFENQVRSEELGEVPKFADMNEYKVYYSLNRTFPFADIVFRAGEKLYCIQVTRSKEARELDQDPLTKFMKRMGVCDYANITFILCPLPSLATTAKLPLKYHEASTLSALD